MPIFGREFVLISRVQSLHLSSQLFGQDGRHCVNGWRDEIVLVNFIYILGRLSRIFRITFLSSNTSLDNSRKLMLVFWGSTFFMKLELLTKAFILKLEIRGVFKLLGRLICSKKKNYQYSSIQLKLQLISATTNKNPHILTRKLSQHGFRQQTVAQDTWFTKSSPSIQHIHKQVQVLS